MLTESVSYSKERLARHIKSAVTISQLSLANKVVLTEAATGAYAVTAVMAAYAGATRVYAYCKESKHGTAEECREHVIKLAEHMDVSNRISVKSSFDEEIWRCADIVTNSGNVRPITKDKIVLSLSIRISRTSSGLTLIVPFRVSVSF